MSRKKIVITALIVTIAVVGIVAICLIIGLPLETILQPKIYPIVPISPVAFFN